MLTVSLSPTTRQDAHSRYAKWDYMQGSEDAYTYPNVDAFIVSRVQAGVFCTCAIGIGCGCNSPEEEFDIAYTAWLDKDNYADDPYNRGFDDGFQEAVKYLEIKRIARE